MPKHLATLALALLTLTANADAQAPAALPPRIDVIIGVPGAGPARMLNATITMSGLPWSIEGCVSPGRGSCRATHRVELDEAARTELVQLIAATRTRLRCEREGFAPGDPEYELQFDGAPHVGHLPRDTWPPAARDAGPCGASSQLAAWTLRRFGVERR